MFDGWFGGKVQEVDGRDWHPRIDQALGYFEARQWGDLSLLVARQSVDSAFRLITALGARSQLDAEIGKIPRTPGMLMIIGGVQTVWAWRHRGFGSASEVDDDRWPRFYKTLELAADHLSLLLDIRENSAVGLAFMGRVLTGTNEVDSLSAVEKRFSSCQKRPLDGCAMFLQARSPKWHGDHDAMFAYAREESEDENLHPGRHALLARAHIEKWLYDAWMDDDEAVNEAGRRYMSSPEVVREICDLNSAFNADMAEDPDAQKDDSACRFAHDNLGFALYLAGQKKEAARHVAALGAHPGLWPWVYALGDPPASEWSRLRKSLGLSRSIKS